jgi:hypothetical protein
MKETEISLLEESMRNEKIISELIKSLKAADVQQKAKGKSVSRESSSSQSKQLSIFHTGQAKRLLNQQPSEVWHHIADVVD